VQVSNLELQDSTREALLMRSLVMLSERIRSRPEHIALADLDQIRREVFEGA
jgi:hypothetical protein